MRLTPRKGHEALRKGRLSIARTEYFLTFCTQDKRHGLTDSFVLEKVLAMMRQLETERAWHVRTLVIMPDHIHLLAVLGSSTELVDAVRLFKGRMSPVLQKAGLRWQPAYFDHRIREDDDAFGIFLYIFLNPYRAELLKPAEQWSGYYCCAEDWKWFSVLTQENAPVPEWLA